MSIKHSSSDPGGLSQLDSVFAQMREAAQGAKSWELEVETSEEHAALSLAIEKHPPKDPEGEKKKF